MEELYKLLKFTTDKLSSEDRQEVMKMIKESQDKFSDDGYVVTTRVYHDLAKSA